MITERIDHPEKLGAAFAAAVTIETAPGQGWLARNGEDSVFRTLHRILPKVPTWKIWAAMNNEFSFCVDQIWQQEKLGSKRKVDGEISKAAFNKMLERSCGFMCARTRVRCLVRYTYHDPI